MTAPRGPDAFDALERHPLTPPERHGRALPGSTGPDSPFEFIRCVTAEGREYWSARDLMPLLGYPVWRDFANAIGRAKVAAHNSGHQITDNFAGARKVAASGPSAEDYHLSRYACYLVALNGDPRKPEIAAAQTYFVIRTREAETAPSPSGLPSRKELAQWVVEAEERAELAESKVAELTAPAAAWNELAEAAGDYSVSDSAKVLSRDPAIKTGERRLFQSMQAFGWLYRENGRWRAYQRHVDIGWLVEKVGRPYWHAGREEMVAGEPTVRITPKGLAQLHFCLGGTGQLALMAGA